MVVHPKQFWAIALAEEIDRQSREWDDNIAPEVWGNVINEESGEVAEAILDGDLVHAQEELLQVAAICYRMFHSLDRANAAGWQPSWPTEPRSKHE